MERSGKNMTVVTVVTRSATETEALGEAIGRRLRGGEVIALASDLGGGKTTFVRGLARGAGSDDHVSSPTFTVSKLYRVQSQSRGDNTGGDHRKLQEIHHFDFYRLQEAGIMRSELAELIGDPSVVVVVEWSDIVADVLPEERLMVRLATTGTNETERRIEFAYLTSLSYLAEDLPGRQTQALERIGEEADGAA